MSITVNAVHRRVQYVGNGSNLGAFSFSFKVLAATDIKVSVGTTVKTVTTHYTTSLNADGTGSVTFTSGNAPANNAIITIESDQAIERTTDYSTGGDFTAASINDALDRLTINDQQIETLLSRNVQLASTVNRTTSGTGTSGPLFFPYADTVGDQAGKLIAYDSNGTALETTTGRVSSVAASNVAVDGSGNSQSATVSFNSSTGALALGIPVGTTGATGATGSQGPDGVGGLPYTFSTTTTDSDPGAGQIRLNNGTLGSVSQIFIDDSSAASGNPDVSAFILTWDDSTQTSDRGQVTITKKAAQQNFATYKISGASTDASGYVKLAVTHLVSNGSLSNSDAVLVSFVRTGNAGSLADPMTTRGDIIVRDASNATARLAVGGASTVLKSDGTDASWGYTVGTSANNLVQLNGSAALPAVSGANLTNLPASGGTVDLVADGSITAGKPVAITADGKVKQISATGYTMTESIGSTVATSSRNPSFAYLVYDESNDEVLSGINISGNSYFARVTLDASMNTAYTGELTYAHGSTDWLAGIGMVYNPALDRIWCGPFRLSNTHGYLLRNNSGTLSGSNSVSFGTSAPYGSVDVNRSTGAMYIASQGTATGGASGMGYADTSISEEVKAHNSTHLGSTSYGQGYSYYAAFRHIPHVGLVYMRLLYDIGIEFQFLTSEQWNKDQLGAYNSSSLTGGTIGRYGTAPTLNSTSTPDRTIQVVADSGTGQRHYPSTSQWHPWARRLIMPGRSRAGTGSTISTISFQNAMAEMSYGVGLTGVPEMTYHGPHFVPIPETNAFIVVYYDSADSNKLTYRTIDIKLGSSASEDDFVVSAARQIDTNSNSNIAAVWDQNRQAMVVSANHTSEQRFYGVKPQLGISNARNFIGFASSTVSDTQTLTVHLPGAVNENQSNLVVGRRYLVGHDGNLIEADNNPGKSQGMPFTGTAIAATKIMVGA
jgi:hypothetical protein